jgi:hypothetical protein
MEGLFALVLLTIVGVLEIIMMLRTVLLPIEAVLIFVLLIGVLLLLFRLGNRGIWMVIVIMFIINIFNSGFLYLMYGGIWFIYVAFLLSLCGLLFSMMMAGRPKRRRVLVPQPVCKEMPEGKAQVIPMVEKEIPERKGRPKYVASKKGGQYHIPDCRLAKRINKQNRTSFYTKEEAETAGHKAHDCVE